jgi:hypothetical protein
VHPGASRRPACRGPASLRSLTSDDSGRVAPAACLPRPADQDCHSTEARTGARLPFRCGNGRFAIKLLTTTVCSTCNGELGRVVDEELLRTGPEGVARALLGVEGRHDSSPNPVYYKAATTQPVRMNIVDDNGSGFFMEPFHRDGKGRGKPARQIHVVGEDGQPRYLLLNLAWRPDTLRP